MSTSLSLSISASPRLHLANHSCSPNVFFQTHMDDDGRAWAVLRALRPLKTGEELCISYVDGALATKKGFGMFGVVVYFDLGSDSFQTMACKDGENRRSCLSWDSKTYQGQYGLYWKIPLFFLSISSNLHTGFQWSPYLCASP